MAFTDEELERVKRDLDGFRSWATNEQILALIARLEAAEKVCNEGFSVAYNNATTVGTKTNSEMPQWFLARIKELDSALKTWRKECGR